MTPRWDERKADMQAGELWTERGPERAGKREFSLKGRLGITLAGDLAKAVFSLNAALSGRAFSQTTWRAGLLGARRG